MISAGSPARLTLLAGCIFIVLAEVRTDQTCVADASGQCQGAARPGNNVFHGEAAKVELRYLTENEEPSQTGSESPDQIWLGFRNALSIPIKVLWVDVATGDQHPVETLQPNVISATMTLPRHVFAVTSTTSDEVLALFKVPSGSPSQVVVFGEESSCFVHKSDGLDPRDATIIRNAEKTFIEKRDVGARQAVYSKILADNAFETGDVSDTSVRNLALARMAEIHLLLGNASHARALLDEAVAAGGRTAHHLLAAHLYMEHGRQIELDATSILHSNKVPNTGSAANAAKSVAAKVAAVGKLLRTSSKLSRRASLLAKCATEAEAMGPAQLMLGYKHLIGDYSHAAPEIVKGVATHPLDLDEDEDENDPVMILSEFYRKHHQPNKVASAAATVAQFKNKLSQLAVLLANKYGDAPVWGDLDAVRPKQKHYLELDPKQEASLRCDAASGYYQQASLEVLLKERKTARTHEVCRLSPLCGSVDTCV
jgi:hypothetical protein